MAIHITGSKLRQIIKEELRLFETKDKGPPEEISYEVEVLHRPHDHVIEIADAIQHAQMRAIDDHENRYDISDDHVVGYEKLDEPDDGKVRYRVYLTLIKR